MVEQRPDAEPDNRAARPPQQVESDAATDSAGTPWHARSLTSTGFDDDQGSADPALMQALGTPTDEAQLMAAVSAARWLVPVVAEPVETGLTEDGLRHDKQVDMASVTLVAPDGTRALPVFSSMEELTRWDAQARPVPVTAARAAQAAVSESCQVMVIDVAGAAVALRPSMVWALAQQRPWLPAADDPFVVRGVAEAVAPFPQVVSHSVAAGDSGALQVRLQLRAGLSRDEVQHLATAIGEQLARDGELRSRIDALTFAVE